MTLPIIVVMDHSGQYYANLQRRLKSETFDYHFYYQNNKYLNEIAQLKPDVIVVGRQHGFPQNHRETIASLRSYTVLKTVPIILSLVQPLEEPDAAHLKLTVVQIDPALEHFEDLIATIHSIVGQ